MDSISFSILKNLNIQKYLNHNKKKSNLNISNNTNTFSSTLYPQSSISNVKSKKLSFDFSSSKKVNFEKNQNFHKPTKSEESTLLFKRASKIGMRSKFVSKDYSIEGFFDFMKENLKEDGIEGDSISKYMSFTSLYKNINRKNKSVININNKNTQQNLNLNTINYINHKNAKITNTLITKIKNTNHNLPFLQYENYKNWKKDIIKTKIKLSYKTLSHSSDIQNAAFISEKINSHKKNLIINKKNDNLNKCKVNSVFITNPSNNEIQDGKMKVNMNFFSIIDKEYLKKVLKEKYGKLTKSK